MPDIKQNFFIGSGRAARKEKPVEQTPVERWVTDKKFREGFAGWLHQNFDTLVAEHKRYGRFLTLQEINDSIL